MKKLLIFLVLVGVAIAAGAYWLNHSAPRANGQEAFTLAPVVRGSLRETVSATGILQPQEIVAVGSELSGKVVEIYANAEVNKTVQAGEPLLKLDDRLAKLKLEEAETAIRKAEAGIERAKAAHSAAETKVNRLKKLPEDLGPRKELDEAELMLKSAAAAVSMAEVGLEEAKVARKQAQYGLDLAVVRATSKQSNPHSASEKRRYTIIDRKVVLGQLIAPPVSAQLFTLAADLSQMQVRAHVSENDIGKIRTGLAATFTVYAYSEEEARFSGKVSEIRPMPASQHGAVFYETIIDIANERDRQSGEWKLRPGMTASVDFTLREHAGIWKVPTAALNLQLDEAYQSQEAKAKIARWRSRSDFDDWKPAWILDARGKPWPIFVRVGGKNKAGEAGIGDGQYNEIIEWDPELDPQPVPESPATHPQMITSAPPVIKGGLFDRPTIKIF